MREYGGWLRPAWYGGDDPDAAIQREATRARETVGAVRRLVARQDRGDRPGRGEARRLPQLQPPLDAEARKNPLRLHPVGDRRRLRRRRHPAPRRGSLPRLLLVGPHRCGRDAARTLAAGSFRSAPRRHSRHDRAMGDADADRPARPRPRRRARSRARARRPEPAAYGLRDGRLRRRAAARRARQLHRRPLLRTFRSRRPRAGFARAHRREAAGVRRRAARARRR